MIRNIIKSNLLNGIKNVTSYTSSGLKSSIQTRNLHLHEYQSLALMKLYGVNLPEFKHVSKTSNPEVEAENLRKAVGEGKHIDFVVKAQVLSGGRGLGYFKENNFKGGVHIVNSSSAVKEFSQKMLGNTLITKQTGQAGKVCNSVLISERFYIRQERYVAILMDRAFGGPILLGSSIGGTSIEDIAHSNPECIIKIPVNYIEGLTENNLNEFVTKLGFSGNLADQAKESIRGLYKMFIEKDCLLVEANPFAETHDGRILVCDAKVTFDDNAKFRHEDIFALQDFSQEDPREVEASLHDLNYVGLDGNVGCMVNGAGLAMATMDILQLHGGSPANFLDVGGGANNKQIVEALRILQNDNNIKSIFINIFGGIMRCDIIAQGIIEASAQLSLTKPIIIRLEGTNQKEAKDLLYSSGLPLLFETDFNTAAKLAVNIAKLAELANETGIKVSFSI